VPTHSVSSKAAQVGPVTRFRRDADAKIVCEDNLKFMRRLSDESMHLVVTSPPNNLGKEYEKSVRDSVGDLLRKAGVMVWL